jgi:gas vesicle protein
MPHEERPPVVVIERSNGIGSFLLGALLGAGAALLFAPRTGQETRDVLRTKGRQLRSKAEETAGELHERLEGGYVKARAKVEERFDRARQSIGDTREGAREAVAAGKAAVHSARDELEKRLSEAREAKKRGAAGGEDVAQEEEEEEGEAGA